MFFLLAILTGFLASSIILLPYYMFKFYNSKLEWNRILNKKRIFYLIISLIFEVIIIYFYLYIIMIIHHYEKIIW